MGPTIAACLTFSLPARSTSVRDDIVVRKSSSVLSVLSMLSVLSLLSLLSLFCMVRLTLLSTDNLCVRGMERKKGDEEGEEG